MPDHSIPPDTETLKAAGTALAADHVAADVARTLVGLGIAAILLRGPSIARHLYSGDEVRPYVDVDLLVTRESRRKVEAILEDLGFSYRAVLGQRSDDRPQWSSTWVRDLDGANVDVHWTLVGVQAAPDTTWKVLSAEVEPLEVLGTRIDGLTATASALVVALHAAHHGLAVTQPMRDLERALTGLALDIWRGAAQLARRLDALDAFTAGLHLVPAGVEMAHELALPPVGSTEALLRSTSAPPTALGIDWLAQTKGVRAKAALMAGKVAPDAGFMREWKPVARRGRLGLAAAYAWRPLWLLWHVGPGFRAWRQARRQAGARRGL